MPRVSRWAWLLVAVIAAGLGGCASRLPVGDASPRVAAVPAEAPRLERGATEWVRTSEERSVTRAEVPYAERTCELPECEEEEYERHKVNLFVGYTFERAEDGFTIGGDYEYRFSQRYGVGVFAEHIGGDLHAWALGVGLYVHPWRELVLFLGPGIEIVHEKEEGHEGEEGESERKTETEFLFRVGAGYEIPLRCGFSVAPAVYVDFLGSKKQAVVVGLSFGKGF